MPAPSFRRLPVLGAFRPPAGCGRHGPWRARLPAALATHASEMVYHMCTIIYVCGTSCDGRSAMESFGGCAESVSVEFDIRFDIRCEGLPPGLPGPQRRRKRRRHTFLGLVPPLPLC